MSTKRGVASAPSTRTNKTRRSVNERSECKSQFTERSNTTKQGKGDGYSVDAKQAMKQFTYQTIQGGLHSLRVKYAELKNFVPADPSRKVFDANQNKCRYKDVPCWDKTRVILTWPPGIAGDFVHANRVTHELLEGQQFICCQGPLDATVADFWRCVWQEKVKQIIMLCRCEEMGKNKCAQYWPLELGGAFSFHGLRIKCEKVDTSDRSFVHSKLSLTYEKETRMVDHRQWTSWPDKSVPKTPMAPFRLLQYTRKNPQYPTVIHCSAGVGRTGTLLMIEIIYKSLLKGKIPDVAQLVKDTRSQRSQAVQTEDQYLYCHYAILLLLHIKKVVPSHFVKHFIREYENYLKLLNDVGGKNLPMQATSVPQPCATCTKVAAHMNESKPAGAESPPSESKMDSKKAKDDSVRKGKGAGSKRESNEGGGSKRDSNGNKNEDKNGERKANLLKQLKTQKEEKEKRGKIRASGEPYGNPSPTTGTVETKEQQTPTPPPPPVPDVTNQTCDPNEDLKPVDISMNPHKTSKEKCNQPPPQTPPQSDGQQQQVQPQSPKMKSPPGGAVSAPALQQQPLKSPPPSSPQPQQQQQSQPQTPAAAASSEPQPIQLPLQPQQQQQSPQPKPVAASVVQQQPQTQEKISPGPQKYQYKPALTYTVQQAGTEKAAIVYHRNANQPFIKAIASPAGVPQPVCYVQQPQGQPQQQQQQQPLQPQQQQQNPNQPGAQQKS